MKVPLSWLKEFITTDLSPEEIGEKLTLAGLEVDAIDRYDPGFSGVVTALVQNTKPHPEAENLCIAEVFDGTETVQIVCGAPNCRPGLKTALAKIGAKITDPTGKVHKIKKGKLRGIESYGMLCSEKELGLSEKSEGIIELDAERIEGIDLAGESSDVIFEISLTPNLGHCQSILGVARELAAQIGKSINQPPAVPADETSDHISIEIQEPTLCTKYACRFISNVKVAPAPQWMRTRLEMCGINSINNLVDIGNYVMLEYGRPVHVFDYSKISGKKIIVKALQKPQKLKTLDGQIHELSENTLVIHDATKPVAIAGIIGSEESAVSHSTKDILIEAANFNPSIIRKMSKEYNLRTDSAIRIEKGTDPLILEVALTRAAELVSQIAHGKAAENNVAYQAMPILQKEISCRPARANRLLGTHLSSSEIVTILKRLEIELIKETDQTLLFSIPSYRNDLVEEIDLIEEIARLYGFNNISVEHPLHVTSTISNSPLYSFEKKIRTQLISAGLNECMTCDLISPKIAQLTAEKNLGPKELITVLQPSSVDQSVMRSSLLPGLLQTIKFNSDRQEPNFQGFEIGRIHFQHDGKFCEQTNASIILSGLSSPHHHSPKTRPCDFFDLKGIIINLFSSLHIDNVTYRPSHLDNFHPFRQAQIEKNQEVIGVIGEIHPTHARELDISEKVFFAELNLHTLMSLCPSATPTRAASLYPSTYRDWTLNLNKKIPIDTLFEAIQSLRSKLLEKTQLIDIFEGKQLAGLTKNVTLRFVYRHPEKTISAEAVEREHTRLVEHISKQIKTSE